MKLGRASLVPFTPVLPVTISYSSYLVAADAPGADPAADKAAAGTAAVGTAAAAAAAASG